MNIVTPSLHQKQLEFENNQFLVSLFGSHDKNLKALEGKFQVKLYNRGNFLSIKGKRDPVEKAYFIIEGLYKRLKNKDISQEDLEQNIKIISGNYIKYSNRSLILVIPTVRTVELSKMKD